MPNAKHQHQIPKCQNQKCYKQSVPFPPQDHLQSLQVDPKVFDAVFLALVDSRLQDHAQVGPDVDLQDPLVGFLNDNLGV